MIATCLQGSSSSVAVVLSVELLEVSDLSDPPPPPSIKFIMLPTVSATEEIAGVNSDGVATSISTKELTTILQKSKILNINKSSVLLYKFFGQQYLRIFCLPPLHQQLLLKLQDQHFHHWLHHHLDRVLINTILQKKLNYRESKSIITKMLIYSVFYRVIFMEDHIQIRQDRSLLLGRQTS